MSIAFTCVPENFDVRHLILKRHKKLFDDGLNETYFDVVMDHFEATLKELNVHQEVIDAAVEVVMPLRDVFVEGSLEAKERKQKQDRQNALTKLAAATVVATLLLVVLQLGKKPSKRA